ncbi:MAG: hypothetical protein M3Q97_05900 [Bacteroidota bacterium]|nr:hypothetical protein [Bacteroidota bacterium]
MKKNLRYRRPFTDNAGVPWAWWIPDGEWWKDNIWGTPTSYGKVPLTEHEKTKSKKV